MVEKKSLIKRLNYFELSKSENTTNEFSEGRAQKFMAFNAYIRKRESSKN